MYVIKDSNSGLLDSIVRLLPRGAREDGEEEADGSTRRRRGSPDSGINAEFLKTLLQPDEDEKKLVKNMQLGMWIDNMEKVETLKRKADGNAEIAAKVARIERHLNTQFEGFDIPDLPS